MMTEPVSAMTAAMTAQRQRHLQAAIHTLLHRLKSFVEVYPFHPDDKMPEHDVVWVTGHDDGPDARIVDAIKAHPELWAPAIPEDVCVVSRKSLSKAGLSDDIIAYLASEGAALVDSTAARHLHEQEEKVFRKKRP